MKKLFGYSMGLIISLFGLIVFMVGTTSGLRLSLKIGQYFSPQKITITGVHGRLWGNIRLEDVRYQDKSMHLYIKQFLLQWNPSHLWHRQFFITQITANDIEIKRLPSSSSSTHSLSFPDLKTIGSKALSRFHMIKIKNMTLNRIDFQTSDTPSIHHTLQQVSFTANNGAYTLIAKGDKPKPFTLTIHAKQSTQHPNMWQTHLEEQGQHSKVIATSTLTQLDPDKKWQKVGVKLSLKGQWYQQTFHGASQLLLHPKGITIQDSQFNMGANQWSMQGSVGVHNDLQWQIHLPNLSQFDPRLQGSLQSKGTFKKNILHAQLTAQSLKFYSKSSQDFTFPTIQLKTTLKASQKSLAGDITFNEHNKINLNITLAKRPSRFPFGFFKQQQKFSADFKGQFSDLSFLSGFLPKSTLHSGTASFHVKIEGSPSAPHITANGQLNIAQLYYQPLNLTLKNISLHAKPETTQIINWTGQVQSGEGLLSCQGQYNWSTLHFSLHTKGKNILIANTPEYKITASPDLHFSIHDHIWSLNGNIVIPKATLKPKRFNQALGLPDEVVFTDVKKSKQKTLSRRLKLNITLGDAITLNAAGLQANLTGALSLNEKVNQTLKATGALYIQKGQYNAYGQSLSIKDGRLLFSGGPVNNPTIHVKAIKTLSITPSGSSFNSFSGNNSITTSASSSLAHYQSVTVGVIVSGSLKSPTLTLFSIPSSLSQSEILSLLVLGQPLSSASSNQAALLASALSSANGTQSTQIIHQLQRHFGLNELGVKNRSYYDTDTQSYMTSPTLVMGKALSSRLFIDYSVGMKQAADIFRVKYLLKKHWLLQSETNGNTSGIDLLYTFSHD